MVGWLISTHSILNSTQHVIVNVLVVEISPGSCFEFLLVSAKTFTVFSPVENPTGTEDVSACTSICNGSSEDSGPVMITEPIGNPFKVKRAYPIDPFSVLIQVEGGSTVIVGSLVGRQEPILSHSAK